MTTDKASAPSAQRVRATYWLQTAGGPERVAAVRAGEQPTGTFTRLPYETEELLARCAAVVERVVPLGESAPTCLPVDGRHAGACREATVELSWSDDNVGVSLPNRLATVAGSRFELREVTGLRLLALQRPDAYVDRYPGLRDKFSEPDESVIRSARACLTPRFPPPQPSFEVMPMFSSGQWAEPAFDTYRALGRTDLIYASGGGIAAHPGGIAAGVASIRFAWVEAGRGHTSGRGHGSKRRTAASGGVLSQMTTTQRPLVGFYGDDFTGSTDAMEALASQGQDVLLLLRTPTDGETAKRRWRASAMRASAARGRAAATVSPGWTSNCPRPSGNCVRWRHSSPTTRSARLSIRRPPSATSGARLRSAVQSLRAAAPGPSSSAPRARGRYTAFGHLLASAHDGNSHRIDRHPTMSRHPVTPMDESDLIAHLARQTALRGSAFHCAAQGRPDARERFGLAMASHEMLLLDVLDDASRQWVGEPLWQLAQRPKEPLFCVGSAGVAYGLAAHWRRAGTQGIGSPRWHPVQPERIAGVSGSGSPVTARQVDCAEVDGFVCLRADATKRVLPDVATQETARLRGIALPALGAGRSVLIYTARGPHDTAIVALDAFVRWHAPGSALALSRIGKGLGVVRRDMIPMAGLRRIAVAGGDTSGHAVQVQMQVLGLSALRLRAPLTPGAPRYDGVRDVGRAAVIEIALRRGQTGSDRYFASVATGRPLS